MSVEVVRPSKRRHTTVAFFLLGVIGLTACNQSSSPPTAVGPERPSSPPVAAPVPPAAPNREHRISDSRLQLPSHRFLTSSASPNWATEEVSAATDRQLQVLAVLLAAGGSITSRDVQTLVTPGFQCEPLRPSNVSTAFQDANFSVIQAEATGSPSHSLGGAEGFATALNDLLASLSGAEKLKVKHKTHHIELPGDDLATLTIDISVSADLPKETIQISTTWRCRFRIAAGAPPRMERVRVVRYSQAEGPALRSGFADCTEAVLQGNTSYGEQLAHGVDYWLDRIESLHGIDPSAWQGLAIGDVNGDGLEDVYFCQPGGLPNLLYVQQHDGTALDISAKAGVHWRDHTYAALIVDLDNDSRRDLVLSTSPGIVIQQNLGNGRFAVRSIKLVPEGPPFSLAAADYDEDGDVDLFACCYSKRRSQAEQGFLGRPIPYHDANNGARNVLLRNEGAFAFRDVTRRMGLEQNNRRFSLAAAWEDYDNDGDLDLYVANDYGRNNLYRNDGSRFRDVAAEAGVEDLSAGMSVDWGDYNRDGWMDLYVSNMWSSAGNRIAYQSRFHAEAKQRVRDEFRRHARGNSLFSGVDGTKFHDRSLAAGVTKGYWAWGSSFVDINNDGWEDLFVANGFMTRSDPGDL